MQDRFIKQVNDHYEWLETSIISDSIENQRLKQKIHDFSQHELLLTMTSKLWYAFLHLGYAVEDIKNHLNNSLLVPLNIDVYSVCFKLLIKALQPAMFSSEKYVVYNDPNFKKKYVLFDRFKFDLCSLISDHIESDSV